KRSKRNSFYFCYLKLHIFGGRCIVPEHSFVETKIAQARLTQRFALLGSIDLPVVVRVFSVFIEPAVGRNG
ncbi:MAG: hypothetical protein KAT20_07625, partial [Desulfuromonadales bacterium]|nr:hypothetical protein [Desulfuromonadales bacterium]